MPTENQPLPLFVEPEEAEAMLDDADVVVVDLCKPELYTRLHVPGARPLDYGDLIGGVRPAVGLLPPLERLNQLCAALGIHPQSLVIAYDDEGGGRACRLAWNLHVMGFYHVAVINGGIHAWANEGHRLSTEPAAAVHPGTYRIECIDGAALAVRDQVLALVENRSGQLLDSRTPEEYSGARAFAGRGGHIPGAVNLNWLDTMDRERNLRLKNSGALISILDELGFDPDLEIVTYCHTHHRSSHSYLMLKHLGFERVRGYAGAWAEWGNDPSLPAVTGPAPR